MVPHTALPLASSRVCGTGLDRYTRRPFGPEDGDREGREIMSKVRCEDCVHFRTAPYQAPRTGCYHPDHMTVRQKDAYLDEQQKPGDHEKINLRGDCATFEQRPAAIPFWRRLFQPLAS